MSRIDDEIHYCTDSLKMGDYLCTLMLESKPQLICCENRRCPHQTVGIDDPLSLQLLFIVLFDDKVGQNNVVFTLLVIVSIMS